MERTYCSASILGEVVRRDEAACYAGVHACPSVICGGDDGILEAARVVEGQVKLAVLAVVGWGGVRADVSLERVEAVCDDLVHRLTMKAHEFPEPFVCAPTLKKTKTFVLVEKESRMNYAYGSVRRRTGGN